LVGENTEYSRSPDIFEAIFKHTREAGRFDSHSVSADQLQACIEQMVSEGVSGFSVTIPHKQAVVEYLDEIGPVAKAVQAVNSVMIKNGRLTGYNTDCSGFAHALHASGFSASGGQALILGCGGAARAVINALHEDFAIDRFTVVGRTQAKLEHLKYFLERDRQALIIMPVTEALMSGEGDSTWCIVVNCTPLAGANHVKASPIPSGFNWSQTSVYYDLNYNSDNSVLQEAKLSGVETIDGSAMLVAQAIRSFELWTGRKVEFEPIYRQVFGDG
jgi:shikimate dehydrogenase